MGAGESEFFCCEGLLNFEQMKVLQLFFYIIAYLPLPSLGATFCPEDCICELQL